LDPGVKLQKMDLEMGKKGLWGKEERAVAERVGLFFPEKRWGKADFGEFKRKKKKDQLG